MILLQASSKHFTGEIGQMDQSPKGLNHQFPHKIPDIKNLLKKSWQKAEASSNTCFWSVASSLKDLASSLWIFWHKRLRYTHFSVCASYPLHFLSSVWNAQSCSHCNASHHLCCWFRIKACTLSRSTGVCAMTWSRGKTLHAQFNWWTRGCQINQQGLSLLGETLPGWSWTQLCITLQGLLTTVVTGMVYIWR